MAVRWMLAALKSEVARDYPYESQAIDWFDLLRQVAGESGSVNLDVLRNELRKRIYGMFD